MDNHTKIATTSNYRTAVHELDVKRTEVGQVVQKYLNAKVELDTVYHLAEGIKNKFVKSGVDNIHFQTEVKENDWMALHVEISGINHSTYTTQTLLAAAKELIPSKNIMKFEANYADEDDADGIVSFSIFATVPDPNPAYK